MPATPRIRVGLRGPAGAGRDTEWRSSGGYLQYRPAGSSDAWTNAVLLTDLGSAGTFTFKGAVATVGALPASGNTASDLYVVQADLHGYAWDGDSWVDVGTVQGPQGEQGEQGDQGDQGDQGAAGPSAYDVAVTEGFVGDEAAWLATLVGADGDTGASAYEIAVAEGFVGDITAWLDSLQGTDGTNGTDGEDGDAGADGANGKTVLERVLQEEIAVDTGAVFYTNDFDVTQTILYVRATVDQAGTAGDDLELDVLVNGTTIFTTASNRPVIPLGSLTGKSSTIEDPSVNPGQEISADVTAAGTFPVGTVLTLTIGLA